jgi:hypothetical protein
MGKVAAVVALVVCACGGAKPPVADKPPPPRVDPGPPATRDALLQVTFAALAAGDADALAKLGDLDVISARAITCTEREDNHAEIAKNRERVAELLALAKSKGARVELVGVAKDEELVTIEAGKEAGKHCTAKVRLVFHKVKLDVKVTTASGVKPSHAEVFALEVDGAWYLAEVPSVKFHVASSGAMMQAMRDFKDKMCACKDKACIDAVVEQMTKWSQENAKEHEDKPSEEDMKQGAALGQEMAKCMQAAMSASP